MSYSAEWLRFREVENEYFTARYEVAQDEKVMLNDLQQAVISANNRETALRLLLEISPKVAILSPLLPTILDIAIDSGNLNTIALARNVLLNYKSEVLIKETVLAATEKYLLFNDEWHYRRISELYELLHYKAELADFLMLCKSNENLEIKEISDDFLLRGA